MQADGWLKEATTAYQAGTSLRTLAQRHAVSRKRLRRLLQEQGLAVVRPRPYTQLPTDPQWWHDQFAAGLTVRRFADDAGISPPTVYRHLTRIGQRRGGTPTFEEWLQSHTRRSGDHLLWVGARMRDGFPLTKRNGAATAAHRVIWEHHYDALTDGEFVTHTGDCDKRDCVALTHLEVTHRAAWFAEKSADQAFAWGQQHWNAKLTEDQARRILTEKHRTPTQLAAELGVSPATVRAIRAGRRWRHLHNTSDNG